MGREEADLGRELCELGAPVVQDAERADDEEGLVRALAEVRVECNSLQRLTSAAHISIRS